MKRVCAIFPSISKTALGTLRKSNRRQFQHMRYFHEPSSSRKEESSGHGALYYMALIFMFSCYQVQQEGKDTKESRLEPLHTDDIGQSNTYSPFVSLRRMRSLPAHVLNEKYNVDWTNKLGEGAYGSVHPARLATTGEKVALKKMSKRYTNKSSFRSETDALMRIYLNGGHPNISGLRDMFEDQDYYYLVTDLVSGGEMFDHLIQYGAYSEADAARLMHEVASALAFLHGVGVVHADLKPENLLLCSKKRVDGTIKMIDFGCAVVQDEYSPEEGTTITTTTTTTTTAKQDITLLEDKNDLIYSIGTTAYWPSERFSKQETIPTKAGDMWAVGVILYIMLTGVHPFDISGTATDAEIAEHIKRDPSPPITPRLTGHLSPAAINLIQLLFKTDPNQRISADQMLQHPWITGEEATTQMMYESAQKLSRFKGMQYRQCHMISQ